METNAIRLTPFHRVSICLCLLLAGLSRGYAQEPGNPFNVNFSSLMADVSLQKSLGMTDDQLNETKALLDHRQEVFRKITFVIRESQSDDVRKTLMDDGRAQIKEIDRQLGQILNDAQRTRLLQIGIQRYTASDRWNAGLLDARIVKALGVTDVQQNAIRNKAEDLTKEYEARLAAMKAELVELRKAHVAELLKQLSPRQQEQYAEVFGEPITTDLFGPVRLVPTVAPTATP